MKNFKLKEKHLIPVVEICKKLCKYSAQGAVITTAVGFAAALGCDYLRAKENQK